MIDRLILQMLSKQFAMYNFIFQSHQYNKCYYAVIKLKLTSGIRVFCWLYFFCNINDDDNGLLTGFPCSGSSLVGQTNAVATEIKMREIENKYL